MDQCRWLADRTSAAPPSRTWRRPLQLCGGPACRQRPGRARRCPATRRAGTRLPSAAPLRSADPLPAAVAADRRAANAGVRSGRRSRACPPPQLLQPECSPVPRAVRRRRRPMLSVNQRRIATYAPRLRPRAATLFGSVPCATPPCQEAPTHATLDTRYVAATSARPTCRYRQGRARDLAVREVTLVRDLLDRPESSGPPVRKPYGSSASQRTRSDVPVEDEAI